jgi:hypothetical protein
MRETEAEMSVSGDDVHRADATLRLDNRDRVVYLTRQCPRRKWRAATAYLPRIHLGTPAFALDSGEGSPAEALGADA